MTQAASELPGTEPPPRLAFTLDGPPVPKARARKGKGGRWYTPKQTERYESAVRVAAMVAKHMAGIKGTRWPKDARYRVEITCHFPNDQRRDGDNVLKSVLDACNGMLWNDDVQVATSVTHRAVDRERPRLEVMVEVLPP